MRKVPLVLRKLWYIWVGAGKDRGNAEIRVIEIQIFVELLN